MSDVKHTITPEQLNTCVNRYNTLRPTHGMDTFSYEMKNALASIGIEVKEPRPRIEVTDKMIGRAFKAATGEIRDRPLNDRTRDYYYAVLEAALNGE